MMKNLLIILASVLLLPSIAFAAFDDVTLTTDVVITIDGINLDISGSSAEVKSITVNAANFTFVLLNGGSLQVTSSDRRRLITDADSGKYVELITCDSSDSILKHSSTLARSGSAPVTITITVSSDTCSSSSSSSSSGGGGGIVSAGFGGGGGGSTTTPPVTTTQAQSTPQPSVTAVSISPVFNKVLLRGTSSSNVKRLQQLLNSDPDTQVAKNGVGSSGNETNYFGSLTERALQKFQAKYGIVSSGTPETTGYGRLGPKTRSKLAEVFGGTKSVPAQVVATPSEVAMSVSPVFNTSLSRGVSNLDVKRLQELLNSDPDTKVAENGAGSPGNETNYFGSLTERAVQKFQAKYGVVSSGSPDTTGYGRMGPKTRSKLAEIFSN